MKKKVFSLENFKEHCVARNTWAKECEGLTKEEMNAKGLMVNEDWMVEVDDEIKEKKL